MAAKEPVPMPSPRDSRAGDLHLATVVVNVLDMERAVAFWCDALGHELREPHLDPEFTMLQHPDGRGLPVSLGGGSKAASQRR